MVEQTGWTTLHQRALAVVPFVLFAIAVGVLLGPSLSGERVALAHDIHLQQLPWRDDLRPPPPRNVELRDTVDQYYPVQRELLGRLRTGQDATWIRSSGFGLLGVEFLGWGALSPFNTPALVLPFELAWSWSQALRLYAAMTGTFLLLRRFGVGRTGATVAGLSFGLSGFMTGWLGWPQSHVAAMIPWVLWAVRVGVTRAEREAPAAALPPSWGGPALALTVAALWLGGFPAVAIYGLMAAAAVFLHGLWGARAAGWRWLGSRAVLVGAGVACGTLLIAFTLLPTLGWLDAMDLSAREGALRSRVFPAYLWTFAMPGVFGDVVRDPRWLSSAYVETTGYAGVVTAALLVPAWVLRPRRRGTWLFTGIGVIAGLTAYGVPPVVRTIALVPGLDMNPPPRALVLVSLSIAVVGGFGADALLRWLSRDALTSWRASLVVTAAMLAIAGYVVSADIVGQLTAAATERLEPGARIDAGAAARAALTRAGALMGGAAGVVALAAFARVSGGSRVLEQQRRARVVGLLTAGALVAIVTTDLLLFASGWNVQVPREELFPDGPGIGELQEASTSARTTGADDAGHANVNLVYDIRDLRAHSFLTERQREVLRGAGATFSSPTRWTLDTDRMEEWEPWLSAAGVSRVIAPLGDDLPSPRWRSVEREVVRVLRNPDARQLVSAVPRAEAVTPGSAADRVVAGGLLTLRRTAFVEPGSSGQLLSTLPDGDRAEVLSWSQRGAVTRARVASDGGAVLIALDPAVPGWSATVEGVAADVLTADHLFIGVVVPAGEHDVELRYVAPGSAAGRRLSLVGGLLLLALGWHGTRRRCAARCPDGGLRSQSADGMKRDRSSPRTTMTGSP